MMNRKNPAIKRILADVKELDRHPSSRYHAAPLEENMFEWHFTIRGPSETPFESGIYHGRILLPSDYPFKPPNIVFLTKNGRFEVGTKICLSISAYHEETWQPAWGVRTMLEAIISFLPSEGAGAIGALDWTAEERKRLARESHTFQCPTCGLVKNLLTDPEPAPAPTTKTNSKGGAPFGACETPTSEHDSGNGKAGVEPTTATTSETAAATSQSLPVSNAHDSSPGTLTNSIASVAPQASSGQSSPCASAPDPARASASADVRSPPRTATAAIQSPYEGIYRSESIPDAEIMDQVAQLQMRAAQPSNSPGVPGGRMMGGYLNDFPTGDDGTLLEASDAFRANFSAGPIVADHVSSSVLDGTGEMLAGADTDLLPDFDGKIDAMEVPTLDGADNVENMGMIELSSAHDRVPAPDAAASAANNTAAPDGATTATSAALVSPMAGTREEAAAPLTAVATPATHDCISSVRSRGGSASDASDAAISDQAKRLSSSSSSSSSSAATATTPTTPTATTGAAAAAAPPIRRSPAAAAALKRFEAAAAAAVNSGGTQIAATTNATTTTISSETAAAAAAAAPQSPERDASSSQGENARGKGNTAFTPLAPTSAADSVSTTPATPVTPSASASSVGAEGIIPSSDSGSGDSKHGSRRNSRRSSRSSRRGSRSKYDRATSNSADAAAAAAAGVAGDEEELDQEEGEVGTSTPEEDLQKNLRRQLRRLQRRKIQLQEAQAAAFAAAAATVVQLNGLDGREVARAYAEGGAAVEAGVAGRGGRARYGNAGGAGAGAGTGAGGAGGVRGETDYVDQAMSLTLGVIVSLILALVCKIVLRNLQLISA